MANVIDVTKLVDSALDGNPLSEDALALRFSERHKDALRYVAVRSQWYRWDSIRWNPENTLLVFDLIRQSCRDDAATYGNGTPPKRLFTAKTVGAVHYLARVDRRQAMLIEQFDADPRKLTTTTETYDLRSANGEPPVQSHYITKIAACSAAGPGTPHPVWTAFLDRITRGDVELQNFLQRYAGYCLTGETSEHVFVFAYGTGANGKSTYINTLVWIMGDYATIADVGTFMASHGERHPTDVAKLHGARLVVAQETQKGRQWDEAKIKALTGGDKQTARFMRQDFFDFIPQFKLFITGNHKPRLDNVDVAMRRRLLLVPFTVQIPAEDRDPDLPNKLRAEGPAILRWMLDGCLEWQRLGLAPPKVVTDATEEYFSDQDIMQQWLDECTKDAGPHAFIPIGTLYSSWKHWCEDRGIAPGSSRSLSDALIDRGFVRKRAHGGKRGFRGLDISRETQDQEWG
jgi:putative DNA primase/helicase